MSILAFQPSTLVAGSEKPLLASESAPPSRSTLFPASYRAILVNYLCATALLLPGYALYLLHPYYRELFSPIGYLGLRNLLVAYLVLLPLYYATFPDSHMVKCRLFWQAVVNLGRRWPTRQEQVALRAVLVKAFFLPLMVNWLMQHFQDVAACGREIWESPAFFPTGYWLIYRLIFLIDVLFFTIGYAVEHPWLKNEIRSVEPTWLGWLAALACYPPLFLATRQLLGWCSTDYPAFAPGLTQWTTGIAMLVLFGIYTWASVALGFKASNLTNRGIVSWGPYAYIRHPAYAAKNLGWWLGGLFWIAESGVTDPGKLCLAVFSLAGWSTIYILRAITEERHLSQDPDYVAYCAKVRRRFIPGLI